MKIAVSAQSNSLEGIVDPRFGRAAGFVLYDTDSNEVGFVDNVQNLNAPQGAGIQAAQNVLNTGAEVVISGHCGPKAFKVLSAAGIKIIVAPAGSQIKAAIDDFLTGKLQPADSADVEGHWV